MIKLPLFHIRGDKLKHLDISDAKIFKKYSIARVDPDTNYI